MLIIFILFLFTHQKLKIFQNATCCAGVETGEVETGLCFGGKLDWNLGGIWWVENWLKWKVG
jgi:hypothetical protein